MKGNFMSNENGLVNTYWQIGDNDGVAIWFIKTVGNTYQILDYYENAGEGVDHYAQVVKDKGYKYGKHYAPPVVGYRFLGWDRTLKEIAAEDFGINFTVLKLTPISGGIKKARNLFPRCLFNLSNCEKGIEGIKELFKGKSTNNASDAFRYFAAIVSP